MPDMPPTRRVRLRWWIESAPHDLAEREIGTEDDPDEVDRAITEQADPPDLDRLADLESEDANFPRPRTAILRPSLELTLRDPASWAKTIQEMHP